MAEGGCGFESRLLETCRWHVSTGVALPQQSESTTGRAGTRVAVRPWAAIANHGRRTPNPKGRTGCSIAKSTRTGVCNDILPFATLSLRGAHTHRSGRPASNRRRRLLASRGVRPHTNTKQRQRAIWANNVRPYGSAGADEFTNGVPRSYPKAPSLVAFTAVKANPPPDGQARV